jgi:hypothetical protein
MSTEVNYPRLFSTKPTARPRTYGEFCAKPSDVVVSRLDRPGRKIPWRLIVAGALTVAAAALLVFPAGAAHAQVKQDPAIAMNPAGTTVLDCLTVLGGLNEIDGKHPVVVNQGKPNEQVIELPYEFSNGRFRVELAKSITTLQAVQKNQQEAAQKELMTISKGRGEIRLPEKATEEERTEYLRQTVEFDKRMKELTGAPCSLDGVVRIKDSDLKLDKNEIRAGALSAIDKVREK